MSLNNSQALQRNCPDCNKIILYGSKMTFNKATKRNSRCLSCRTKKITIFVKGRKVPQYIIDKLTKANIGRTPPNKGKKLSAEERLIISIKTKIAMQNPEIRRKLRLAAIKDFESKKGKIYPNYNKNACLFFDKLSKQQGWNLQHAENGGEFRLSELGYWLDAYDKDKNIVVEYFENGHYRKSIKHKQKDIQRLKEIKNLLKCRLFVYTEPTNELCEYE